MTYWQAWIACGLLMSLPAAAQADIYRWDNGQLIPGTQGITPGPAMQLGARVLQFADLSNTNLTGSSFYDYMLHGSDLTRARFSNANLSYTVLTASNLTGADFAGATVIGTYLYATQGFTKEQLYSTASYQAKDLHEIGLGSLNLSGTDFSNQNLRGAAFSGSTLIGASFFGAVVSATFFDNRPAGGFTKEQLYSTASYRAKDLSGIGLGYNDLTGWDFSEQNLTSAIFWSSSLGGTNLAGANLTSADFDMATLSNANFTGANLTSADFETATLTNADLSGAMVTGANFIGTTSSGFTKDQLYSTASYQQTNLRGIGLKLNDLTGWDFSGQDLAGADFAGSTLTSANFAGAVVAGANFAPMHGTWGGVIGSGITLPQLYSTASYQQKNLRGIGLASNDLTGWDFSGQDLTDADLGATLTNANLAEAIVAGASFYDITSQQLYSTASYQQKNLRGIRLLSNLTGWDFSGQDLAGAEFFSSQLTNANFSFADLRGAQLITAWPFQTRNTIRELGAINSLDLAAGETLVVRDSDVGITVNDSMHAVSGGTLELVLGDADWGSTMAVAAGVTPDLGGTLRVRFADQTNLAPLLGTTFDLFDWPAVLETNNRFDEIELPPGTQWDLTQLYVSGTAKLTYIPVTPGDYNRDDTVDAADYVVWRNRLGTTYTPADYDVWRENFGQAIGSGMAEYGHRDSGPGASADPLPIAVPEPATLTLLITACAAHYARRRSTDLQPRSAALNSPPQITQFATKMIKNRGRSFDHLRKNPRVFAFGPSSPGQCAKWAARGG